MTPAELREYLAAEAAHVAKALEEVAEERGVGLPSAVVDALRYGLLSDGKKLRPVLCVTAYRACGGQDGAAVYRLAAALEMIHAYSLIHDDLPCMDDAALRRGRPTTHIEFGEDPAVLAGASLIPAAALEALDAARGLECGPLGAPGVARTLMEASGAGGMVGGQWLDLMGEGQALGADELAGLHRRKTGALLAASLVVGAQAAAASALRLGALQEYGRAIGLAFQIADDILDATASAEALGKNPSDADLDKSTYVSLYGLAGARARAEAEVVRAQEALRRADIQAPALAAIARYIVDRKK